MAPNRGRNRQSDFEEFAPTSTKDFDPEEDVVSDDSQDHSDLDQDGDGFDGREHYENVGKSQMRKAKAVPLGPQYRGSKVGREELQDEDEDDPFSRGFGEESSEDEDEENAADGEESDNESVAEQDGDAADETENTDLSDGEEDVGRQAKRARDDERLTQELKKVKDAEAQQAVSNSLSQANKEDAEKGRAVKKQRTAFDSLLNTRMKLQKSLIAANTLVGTPAEDLEIQGSDAQQAFEAAEAAAFNLWSSLNTFREDFLAANASKKRKRPTFSIDTPTEDLWKHVQSQETESRPSRDATLKKWSAKGHGPSVQSHTGRLNPSAQRTTILDVLQEQLSNSDRLLKKVHAPRSCAPLQLSQRLSEDTKIYDDADFYGLLLKELLEQRSSDSVAASNIDLGFQMRREAKTKRVVNTRASKGRKLRYTVHEKLQNFMAPEDRTRWGERQTDDLFGSLFGQKLGLGEREEDEELGDGIDHEDAGLLMFGS